MSTTVMEAPLSGVEVSARPWLAHGNPALRGPILLATDGAGKSGAALIAARLLARRLDVPLEVVSVLEPQLAYGAALGGTPVYLPEVDDSRRERRQAAVLDFVARFSEGDDPPPVHIRFGAIADEIAEVARERQATLVVLGAAPHRRLNHMVGGERAARVLRSSSVPVLSVPPGFSALPQHAVVGVDFAPASVRAAQTALLLLADGGTLTLLHVISPLLGDMPLRDVEGRDPADAIQTLFERLRDEIRPYVPKDVTVETLIRTDLDIDGILGGAAAVGADVIAVGTHGPRLLERIFLGSVASSVLHAAPQTVLAVPPPPGAEAMNLWLRITRTATSAKPREWAAALDEFTRRNRGRRVAVEVDDPELGAQMVGRGALFGVTYDPHDERVEIMVGDAHRARRHLMHSIARVDSIAMTTDDRSGNEALELRHGGGHTLVLIGS
jgi:nucleotide-binding universal stress UspA family protein